MATTEIVILTDSLDERIQNGVESVTFYDPNTGEKREIELGEANRKHFANHLEKLAKYIEASRVVEAAKPAKKAAVKSDSEISKIRTWAQANGYAVGDRGRIKAEIVEAYNAANQGNVVPVVRENSIPVTDGFDAPEASATLDGDTQVVDNEPQTEVESGSQEVANGTDEAWEGDGPSDAEILNIMRELDNEGKPVTLENLAAKVAENN